MSRSRIVATAYGAVTPLGVEDFEQALYRGESGLAPSETLPGAPAVGEVRGFDPKPWLGGKGVRVLDRCARLLAVAAHVALRDGGLLDESDEAHDVGLVAGTMLGGLSSIVDFDWSGLVEGPAYVNPMHFANTVINAAAGQTAIKHGLIGVNSTISGGHGSGLAAIDYAVRNIALGRAKRLLAGAAEELGAQTHEGLAAAGLLDGLTPGEAGVLLLLETAESAEERGRQALVEVAGFAASHCGRVAVPAAGDLARTIRLALARSGAATDDIACLLVSAGGDSRVDAVEAEALAEVFGSRVGEIPAYAPKAAVGETLGAAGAWAALVGTLALRNRRLPPAPSASSGPLALSSLAQPVEGNCALITSVGCFGDCAALVLRSCP